MYPNYSEPDTPICISAVGRSSEEETSLKISFLGLPPPHSMVSVEVGFATWHKLHFAPQTLEISGDLQKVKEAPKDSSANL